MSRSNAEEEQKIDISGSRGVLSSRGPLWKRDLAAAWAIMDSFHMAGMCRVQHLSFSMTGMCCGQRVSFSMTGICCGQKISFSMAGACCGQK
jgi:hypothetical protein